MTENTQTVQSIFYAPCKFLEEALQKPEEEITYVLCSIMTFTLSLYIPYIRNTTARKLYSTLLGMFLLFYKEGTPGWLPFIQCMVPFIFYKTLPL